MSLFFSSTNSACRRVVQEYQHCRGLSSAPQSFVMQRSEYKDKISRLRKEWQAEHKAKLEKIQAQKDAEDKQTVLRRAVRLRQTRLESAVRIEEARKARAAAMERYRHKLARNHILMAEKDAVQQRRYEAAIADLEQEKSAWITLENMDQKITSALFEVPSTTGLTTKHSDHWRYQIYSVDIRREEHNAEDDSFADPEVYADRLWADRELERRLQAENMLNLMIGTGEERAKYQSILKQYIERVVTDEHLEPIIGKEKTKDYLTRMDEGLENEMGFMGDAEWEVDDDEDDETEYESEAAYDAARAAKRRAAWEEDDADDIDYSYNPFAAALDEADRKEGDAEGGAKGGVGGGDKKSGKGGDKKKGGAVKRGQKGRHKR